MGGLMDSRDPYKFLEDEAFKTLIDVFFRSLPAALLPDDLKINVLNRTIQWLQEEKPKMMEQRREKMRSLLAPEEDK
jgi:hypothetical protein